MILEVTGLWLRCHIYVREKHLDADSRSRCPISSSVDPMTLLGKVADLETADVVAEQRTDPFCYL